jgi:predicted RND superfamily exporter protein
MSSNGYIVLVVLAVVAFCTLSVKSAAVEPVVSDDVSVEEHHSYDQRQTGDSNIRVTLDGAKIILPSFFELLDSVLGEKRTLNGDHEEKRSKK